MDDWDDDLDSDRESPMDDLVALWTAGDVEALWKALTVRRALSGAHAFEAVALFRRHHERGDDKAVTTALLLCTGFRWGRETASLLAGLVDTGILGDDALDDLAATFLWFDQFRFEYPARWISPEQIVIVLDGPEGPISIPIGRVDPDSVVTSERPIAPPLRRWAAARVLHAYPETLDRLRVRAVELGPIDGGAIASGMLDAVDVLDARGPHEAIEIGLGWPRGSVRGLALDALAAIDPEDASRRAAADPDRKVRAWSQPRPARTVKPGPAGGGARALDALDALGEQGELFPD